jgi:hypothetical protein
VYTGGSPSGVAVGERVHLYARLDVYQGTDELVGATVLDRAPNGSVTPPSVLRAVDIGDAGDLSESYASMLVRVENVTVTNSNPDSPFDYDELLLDGGLRLDDLLAPELDNESAVATRFRSVTGILGYSFGHWKLWPRSASDIVDDLGP